MIFSSAIIFAQYDALLLILLVSLQIYASTIKLSKLLYYYSFIKVLTALFLFQKFEAF